MQYVCQNVRTAVKHCEFLIISVLLWHPNFVQLSSVASPRIVSIFMYCEQHMNVL